MSYRFENLRVWQKAMDFSVKVYEVSKDLPQYEIYGLTSQIRRAVTSIPINIAEGSGCRTKKQFLEFLYIALRSQYEVVTIIKLAFRLDFLDKSTTCILENEIAEIGKLLQALINSLDKKSKNQQLKTNN